MRRSTSRFQLPRHLAEAIAAVVLLLAVIVVAVLLLGSGSSHRQPQTPGRRPAPVAGVQQCVYSSQRISRLAQFERLTGHTFDCAELFNDDATSWSSWDDPFFLEKSASDTSWADWVSAHTGRQLVVTQALIPVSLQSTDWLTQGSAGKFAVYARTLARNLIAGGLGRVIIRLSPEANGTWEQDSLPDNAAGIAQWRSFWRQTVMAMRSVPGAHFQFDWAVNALNRPIALASFYPGDDVVDSIGIDAYLQQQSTAAWQRLLTGTDGLQAVAAFARQHGKPLSLPEWAVSPGSSPADTQYLNGILHLMASARVSYESYFYADQFVAALSPGSSALNTLRARLTGN